MEKPFCSPGLSSEAVSLLINTDSIVIKDIDQHENPTKIVVVIQSTVEHMAIVQAFSAKEFQIIATDYDTGRVDGLLIVLMEWLKYFMWQTSFIVKIAYQDIYVMIVDPPCCVVPDDDWNTSRLKLGLAKGLEAEVV